jgi:hypothetical protein
MKHSHIDGKNAGLAAIQIDGVSLSLPTVIVIEDMPCQRRLKIIALTTARVAHAHRDLTSAPKHHRGTHHGHDLSCRLPLHPRRRAQTTEARPPRRLA